jgi:DNA repair ATPase RecN
MEVEEDEEVGFGSLGRAEDAWQQQSSIDLEKEKAKAVREQVKALRVVNDDLSRQLHEQGSLKRENAQLKALLTRQAKKIDALEEKEYELDQLSPWVRNPTNVTAAEELVRTFYAFACDVFEGGGEGDVFFEAGKQMERDGVGPLLPHCGRIFAAFVEGINEVRETYARSLPMIEVGKEAVAKNEKLVSEYQRLEAYSRETEQLLNASANDIDALKEECKVLKEECDKGESVIQSQQAVSSLSLANGF